MLFNKRAENTLLEKEIDEGGENQKKKKHKPSPSDNLFVRFRIC